MIRSTTPSCVASSASSSRPPPATSAIAPVGHAGRRRGLGGDRGEHRVGVRGASTSRAARSRCRTSGTARRRRSSRSAAPRRRRRRRRAARAPCATSRPLGSRQPSIDLADRVGQRGDRRARRRRSRRSRAGVERAAGPAARRTSPASRAGLEVARVGLEDLGRARLERVGDRVQRRVLGRAASSRARATRARVACAARQSVGDRCGVWLPSARSRVAAESQAEDEVVAVHGLLGRPRQHLAHLGATSCP